MSEAPSRVYKRYSLCRIDGDISDANTKVYGMDTPLFPLWFVFLFGVETG